MKPLANSDLSLRDHLAIGRTKLADQRTILAYFRTSIMLVASGIGLIKFYTNDPTTLTLGIILCIIAFFVFILGIISYFHEKSNIKYGYDKEIEKRAEKIKQENNATHF